MAFTEPITSENELAQNNTVPRRPRLLLAASGSVAAIKFGNICHSFSEWADIKAVVTKSSLHFIDKASIPKGIVIYTDEDEWSSWKKIGDSVLHIELRKWADIMVIAPLSANTLGKIAGGLCDNLLTCVVRAWDFSKPLFVAPAMNTFMWNNPFTQRHLDAISELGISLVPPITKRLACGDYGNGAMAEPSVIYSTVMLAVDSRVQHHGQTDPGVIVNTLVHYGIPSEVATEKLPILKSKMVEYATKHAKDVGEGLEVLPGVEPLLQALSSKDNITIGLVTGNLEEIAWMKMDGLGLKKYFTSPNFGGFGSDHTDRGQLVKIAAERAGKLFPVKFDLRVHVGDTPNDIRAAEFGGALAVGVCTGIFSKEELELASNGGAVVLPNLCDLWGFMNLLGIQSEN